jgi:hypothetical protein
MNAPIFHQPQQKAMRRLTATVTLPVWPLAIDLAINKFAFQNDTMPGTRGRAKM